MRGNTAARPFGKRRAVDPELGMLYFSTGNAAPDLNGAIREGDNLFTASLVALDVKTGQYRWHFQLVRHDIWDFDAAEPHDPVRRRLRRDARKGITTVSKGRLPLHSRPHERRAADARRSKRRCRRTRSRRRPRRSRYHRATGSCGTKSMRWTKSSSAPYAIARERSRRSARARRDLAAVLGRNLASELVQPDEQPHVPLRRRRARAAPRSAAIQNATIGPEPDGDTRRYVQGTFGNARDIGTDSRSTLVAMNVTNHKVAWRRLLDNALRRHDHDRRRFDLRGPLQRRAHGARTAIPASGCGRFKRTAVSRRRPRRSSTRACSISRASPAAA